MVTLDQIAELIRAQSAALRNMGTQITELRAELPSLKAMVQSHELRLNEHEQRIIRAEGRLQAAPTRYSTRPMPNRTPVSGEQLAAEYGLREGNTGTYKIPPSVLEDMARKFHEQETSREAVDGYIEAWKKRILFGIAIAVPTFTALGWALTHFLHW